MAVKAKKPTLQFHWKKIKMHTQNYTLLTCLILMASMKRKIQREKPSKRE